MAAINAIAREWADEIRDGIAWVLIWKTGRSWNAHAVWLNSDDDTFEPEDLELARKVLEQDPKAVMVNGYYCGHFGEDMTLAELADGIRWNYENSCNLLDGSTAFPPEPMERPADLPASLPWYGKATSAELDPYVYDGYMSPEDYELMHKIMARLAGKCMDAMLYNANDHPKWWHYYKHAKKYRVRKKYRRRLERQLCDKLLAAAAG